jgi:hypothetical protein
MGGETGNWVSTKMQSASNARYSSILMVLACSLKKMGRTTMLLLRTMEELSPTIQMPTDATTSHLESGKLLHMCKTIA